MGIMQSKWACKHLSIAHSLLQALLWGHQYFLIFALTIFFSTIFSSRILLLGRDAAYQMVRVRDLSKEGTLLVWSNDPVHLLR